METVKEVGLKFKMERTKYEITSQNCTKRSKKSMSLKIQMPIFIRNYNFYQ